MILYLNLILPSLNRSILGSKLSSGQEPSKEISDLWSVREVQHEEIVAHMPMPRQGPLSPPVHIKFPWVPDPWICTPLVCILHLAVAALALLQAYMMMHLLTQEFIFLHCTAAGEVSSLFTQKLSFAVFPMSRYCHFQQVSMAPSS